MDVLDVLLALTCPENLDDEEGIENWEVTKVEIDGEYFDMYKIETVDGEIIEITVQATKAYHSSC